jgi:hypothetical protein
VILKIKERVEKTAAVTDEYNPAARRLIRNILTSFATECTAHNAVITMMLKKMLVKINTAIQITKA